jgi:hypothetical protein
LPARNLDTTWTHNAQKDKDNGPPQRAYDVRRQATSALLCAWFDQYPEFEPYDQTANCGLCCWPPQDTHGWSTFKDQKPLLSKTNYDVGTSKGVGYR